MQQHYKFVNTPLPYAYNALEPYVDELTMYLHHDRHLQSYVDELNHILRAHPALQQMTLEELIENAVHLPRGLQTALTNNAGGVYNHFLYFRTLRPQGAKEPVGVLARHIQETFGGFAAFQKKFKAAALGVFGSGYAWLVSDRNATLHIVSTKNQDTPLLQGLRPIFNIDVWEHAYYLKHFNVRTDYVDDWFAVLNWDVAEQNFAGEKEGGAHGNTNLS